MRNESSDDYIQKENELYRIKKMNKSKINAIISFLLSLIPLLLILFCYISSGGSGDESGAGAIWWLVIIYYGTIGLPVAIVSLILGIISFKNKLAIGSIIITLLPFIYFLIMIFLITISRNNYIIITTTP